MARRKVYEDENEILWEEDVGNEGTLTATYSEPKTGTPEFNRKMLRERAETAIANLEAADTNWDSLTAAQKDAAMRLAVRVAAKLARLVLNRLEAN